MKDDYSTAAERRRERWALAVSIALLIAQTAIVTASAGAVAGVVACILMLAAWAAADAFFRWASR